MGDFIFSRKLEEFDQSSTIKSFLYEISQNKIKEYHGAWGSLLISKSLYKGFNPYENNDHIFVVIGGPILNFRSNDFLEDTNNSTGTELIYRRWINNKMDWVEDLSGPFVILIIDKMTGVIKCYTDMMSFIPVYYYQAADNLIISTHVDILAKVSHQENQIDLISELDFILHGMITYPYTSYKNIFQIAPATEHVIKPKSSKIIKKEYWIPREQQMFTSIDEAAIYLRNSLTEYIDQILAHTTNVAQFISGGEDSRTLAALLRQNTRDAIIFLDFMNREGKIARKIAEAFNANFKLYTREKLHYLDILPDCSNLVGSGSEYHHAHTYGFHETADLKSYTAVFGGLLADALLKGSHIRRKRYTGKLPLIPEIEDEKYTSKCVSHTSFINKDALEEVSLRRSSHLQYVKSFRSESHEEWFELWPSSMNHNIPNIHANRRLFRSYEPFLSNKVVKLSASVPQKWKLNRRLFHKMAKPLLQPVKFVPHGDGWYPYYSWKTRSITYPINRVIRAIAKRIGLETGNQRPWCDWNYILSSKEYFDMVSKYKESMDKVDDIFVEKDILEIVRSEELSNAQKINLLQVLYMRSN